MKRVQSDEKIVTENSTGQGLFAKHNYSHFCRCWERNDRLNI